MLELVRTLSLGPRLKYPPRVAMNAFARIRVGHSLYESSTLGAIGLVAGLGETGVRADHCFFSSLPAVAFGVCLVLCYNADGATSP